MKNWVAALMPLELRTKSLSKSYSNGVRALQNVTVNIPEGKHGPAITGRAS